MKRLIGIFLALSVAGCSRDPSPDSGVTAEEAQALNEIEDMLDSRADPAPASTEPANALGAEAAGNQAR